MSTFDPVAARKRVTEVVGAVARQALRDRGVTRVALLDDGGPEAELAARILTTALGAAAVVRVTDTDPPEPVMRPPADVPAERFAEESRRLRARLVADAVVANPANKTALLLGGDLPPEPLLPLGDLYAAQVEALAGRWSAPEEVRQLAVHAGGVEALDAALERYFEGRDPAALDALRPTAATDVARALARGRASRLWPRIVPKLGTRTLCVDLFE